MKKFNSFDEFWPYYLFCHQKAITRRLHFLGFILYLLSWIPLIINLTWWPIPLSLCLGYLFSFVTHKFIEKSPINLKHPYWGFLATMKMFWLMTNGGLEVELNKLTYTE
jgi:hypothetical protein